MAEPFYRVGELRGPFKVVFDSFEYLDNGRTLEIVRDEMGNGSTTLGYDDYRDYFPVAKRDGFILVPYTVRHSLTEQGVPAWADWVYVGNSPYDYWRLLCDWWTEEFTVIEHDVRATPEIFAEFEACPEPWCYFHYSNHTKENAEAWRYGILGCTRFRDEIIQAVPTALTELGWRFRDWHVLSTGLGMTLREAGFEPHVHGVVDHHRMMDVGGVVKAMAA